MNSLTRLIVFALLVLTFTSACGRRSARGTGSPPGDAGVDAASDAAGTFGDSSVDSSVVDHVSFDTHGCIGAGAASESRRCEDVAFTYNLHLLTDSSSPECAGSTTCVVAQRGCRMAVQCDAIPPILCADITETGSFIAADVEFSGETYTCSGNVASGASSTTQVVCESASFVCIYTE